MLCSSLNVRIYLPDFTPLMKKHQQCINKTSTMLLFRNITTVSFFFAA